MDFLYNFPTAIEVEYHQPLVKFERLLMKKNLIMVMKEGHMSKSCLILV